MENKKLISGQVTAVIPIYNEERCLRQCLESLVDQVEVILLGDNASTDGTEAICREFAEKYPHINYIRHPENIGAAANWSTLMEKLETEFYFTMGGHDFVLPDYITLLKNTLLSNKNAVCAYADSAHVDFDGTIIQTNLYQKFSDDLANPSPLHRAHFYLTNGMASDLCFGLFRSESVLKTIPYLEAIAGCDNIQMTQMLLDGPFVYTVSPAFQRRMAHPNDTQKDYMKRIVGAKLTEKRVRKNYHVFAEKIRDIFTEYQGNHSFSPEEQKLFDRITFYLAYKYGTKIDNPVWNAFFRLKQAWKKFSIYLKCALLPGYAARKGFV